VEVAEQLKIPDCPSRVSFMRKKCLAGFCRRSALKLSNHFEGGFLVRNVRWLAGGRTVTPPLMGWRVTRAMNNDGSAESRARCRTGGAGRTANAVSAAAGGTYAIRTCLISHHAAERCMYRMLFVELGSDIHSPCG
jgi:hypothetical protein